MSLSVDLCLKCMANAKMSKDYVSKYFLPAKAFRGPKTWRFTLSISSLKKRNHAMGMNVITQLSNAAHMPVVMWVHLPTQILGEHRRFLHLAMRCRTAQRQHRVMETVSGGERQYVRLSPHKTCTQTQISKHHSPQTRARFERRTMSMWWNLIFCPFACQECTHLNAGQQQEWGLGGWPSIHGVYEIWGGFGETAKTDFPEKNSGFFGKLCFGDFTENATGGQTHHNPISQWGLSRVHCEINI